MTIDGAKKSRRGRPPADTEAVNVRMSRDTIALVDRWVDGQAEDMSRPEAVRRLAIIALRHEGIG